ncbi:GTPase required for pre-60S ribosomal subunit nuclear export and maturation [Orbilia oligospora]|nr:GTPase required for pre-60S ribosomal subunit nuclear export and maturation [Orbilia oligospora]
MGSFKKESNRRARKIEAAGGSDGMQNVKVKGENFYRDAKKLKRLHMYKEGKAQRDAQGNITKAASYQSREVPSARIEPNRKWFGNTRTISQEALTAFQTAMKEQAKDPRSVLLRRNKLPMSLIQDPDAKTSNKEANKIKVETEPFAQTFGPKAQRKRPKLAVESMTALMDETEKNRTSYDDKIQDAIENGTAAEGMVQEAREAVFSKGQSKRIWNELYKVIDSSDVILHVLDARNPLGTRCRSVEQYMSKECPHKHLVFVLNKCDLVPTGVAVSLTHQPAFLFNPIPMFCLKCLFHRSLSGCLLERTSIVASYEEVCYNFGRLSYPALISACLVLNISFISSF